MAVWRLLSGSSRAAGVRRLKNSEAVPAVRAASHILAEVKVTGPMLSMPTRWATKAVPQIIAVMSRRILPSILLFFIESPFSILLNNP